MRVKLKEIAGIAAGQGAPQGENAYGNAGVPFIKAGHLSDLLLGINENDLPKVTNEVAQKYHLKLYPAGSIVFAKSGMSCMKGYVYQLRSCCYVVSHLAVITPKKKTYGDYLCHYFTFCRPNTLIKDTAYPSISLSDISNLEIKLYPDAFQTQITKTLDTIKQLVFIRQQQLSKLDQLAKSRIIYPHYPWNEFALCPLKTRISPHIY